MDFLQQRIYSNDYADIILPYHYTTSQNFLSFFTEYSPQIINQQYALLHVPVDELRHPGGCGPVRHPFKRRLL